MKSSELRRCQALSMQWVAFALQKIVADARSGGVISRVLLRDARSESGGEPIDTLRVGCSYVLGFVLPLALELGLKSLLLKSAITPPLKHDLLNLFDLLPDQVKKVVELEYAAARGGGR